VEKDSESLTWHVRLSDNEPWKKWVIFAVAAGAAVAGAFLGGVLLAVLGFAIILAATAEHWLGTKFALNSKGASARTGVSVTAIDWGDVKRAIGDPDGIKLTPLEKDGALSPFRGVYLRFGSADRDRIVATVRTLGGIEIGTLERRTD